MTTLTTEQVQERRRKILALSKELMQNALIMAISSRAEEDFAFADEPLGEMLGALIAAQTLLAAQVGLACGVPKDKLIALVLRGINHIMVEDPASAAEHAPPSTSLH